MPPVAHTQCSHVRPTERNIGLRAAASYAPHNPPGGWRSVPEQSAHRLNAKPTYEWGETRSNTHHHHHQSRQGRQTTARPVKAPRQKTARSKKEAPTKRRDLSDRNLLRKPVSFGPCKSKGYPPAGNFGYKANRKRARKNTRAAYWSAGSSRSWLADCRICACTCARVDSTWWMLFFQPLSLPPMVFQSLVLKMRCVVRWMITSSAS